MRFVHHKSFFIELPNLQSNAKKIFPWKKIADFKKLSSQYNFNDIYRVGTYAFR